MTRENPKVLLSLEGALVRSTFPPWYSHYSYEECWRTPGGKFITGLTARLMNDEFIRATVRLYHALERDINDVPRWYRP